MPAERHQLNLKPEHYTIYLRIKEEKEAKLAAAEPANESRVNTNSYLWCPSREVSRICAFLHLNDELLITKPNASVEALGGLDINPHSESFTNIYNMKRTKRKAI